MTNITNDPLYKSFIKDKSELSPVTIERYTVTLTKFVECTNTSLTDIVNNCIREQNRVTEKTIFCGKDEDGNEIVEKIVTKFDINKPDSSIKKYINTFIDCSKARGNKNTTLNNELRVIRTVLNHFSVLLPKIEKFEDDSNNWYLLEKEDFKYVINDSTLPHKKLIKFLQSSGMRLRDALSLTWGDFMEATSEYHNCIDLEDFAKNAPSDMIGCWNFNPNKTKRFDIPCITFNDPETSNLMLQDLRRLLFEYIPRKNKEDNLNIKLSKDDALFGTKRTYFKENLSVKSISGAFWGKNKKLREWRIAKIEEDIKNGKISIEDKKKEIEKIPKFHAHACRKYFETMISRNCGDLRLCTLMEGHVSPVKTDSSYIKKNIEEVKEAYMAAIPDLSLENVDVKLYTSDVRRETEAKIHNLENTVKEKEAEVQSMKERMDNIEKKISAMDSRKSILDKISEK